MHLTERERQIVELVVQGLTGSKIADQLQLAVHTVQCRLTLIFKKLGVTCKSELVSYWLHKGRQEYIRHEFVQRCLQERRNFTGLTKVTEETLQAVVESPGLTTVELARHFELVRLQTMQERLLPLRDRQIIFCHREKGRDTQWFPTIVGLALHKANRDFKAQIMYSEGLRFSSSSPALYLYSGERREECAAVDDTPLTNALKSAREGEMEETANHLAG